MTPPEVSVILPAFNRLAYLRDAIGSVLAQTHTDWELIIADDGSDEETRSFLETIGDERVIVLLLRHSANPAVVRNAALRRARGVYVAFLDSDDVWAPRKLEVQLALMRSHPGRRWSYTNMVMTDAAGGPWAHARARAWVLYDGCVVKPLLEFAANIPTASVVAERTLVDEVGGFDEEQLFGEDCDLWLRCALASEVSVSPEKLVYIRDHDVARYSRDRVAEHHGWVRLFGKMAALVPHAALRSVCLRRRGEVSLVLAGLYFERGDHLSTGRTLLSAARYSWRFPKWWWGAAKATLRPVVPTRILSTYRRLRA